MNTKASIDTNVEVTEAMLAPGADVNLQFQSGVPDRIRRRATLTAIYLAMHNAKPAPSTHAAGASNG